MFGDRQTAARWFPESLVLARELGDSTAVTIGLPIFAVAALEFLRPSVAATLLGAYDEMGRRYGTRMPLSLEQIVAMQSPRERAQDALGPLEFEAAHSAGRAMSIGEIIAYLDETIGQIHLPAGELRSSEP